MMTSLVTVLVLFGYFCQSLEYVSSSHVEKVPVKSKYEPKMFVPRKNREASYQRAPKKNKWDFLETSTWSEAGSVSQGALTHAYDSTGLLIVTYKDFF